MNKVNENIENKKKIKINNIKNYIHTRPIDSWKQR